MSAGPEHTIDRRTGSVMCAVKGHCFYMREIERERLRERRATEEKEKRERREREEREKRERERERERERVYIIKAFSVLNAFLLVACAHGLDTKTHTKKHLLEKTSWGCCCIFLARVDLRVIRSIACLL
jgi:hypothetical protein